MSKRVVRCVGIILVFFLIAAIIMVFIGANGTADAENDLSSNTSQSDASSDIYIVKDYNGKIAVFYEGEEEPIKQIDRGTQSLPKADRDMLARGIKVEGEEKLRRLLEDYNS